MLTDRQRDILETIQLKRETDGVSPTLVEIARHLKIPSMQSVYVEVVGLRASGHLEAAPIKRHRTLRLTKKGLRLVLASDDDGK
jgi:Mn-dependent DtxR family transcriptional regulator